MPLAQKSGNITADAYGGGSTVANYIEDVFSTYLYTGNGTGQTITNNIDLSTQGGLVWIKGRSPASSNNVLYDTVRGAGKLLYSNLTNAQGTNLSGYDLTAFTTSGFTLGTSQNTGVNSNGDTSVSWTFRKQPKFFDVVTYTGDGTSNRAVAHSLGSVPGCIMVKATSTTNSWSVYHRSLTSNQYSLVLNSTAAENFTNEFPTAPDSTSFYVRAGSNSNGVTYVAYVFAHDAGGFGLTGTDNVISCGSFTTNGSGVGSVTLGYEPQFVLLKASSTAQDWQILDVMRGFTAAPNASDQVLNPNLSSAEFNQAGGVAPNATGFASVNAGLSGSQTYIYIAIRRGPMKVPTDGTKVYGAVARTGTGATASITSVNFPPDFVISDNRNSGNSPYFWDRLRGAPAYLNSTNVGPEDSSQVNSLTAFLMNGISLGSDGSALINGTSIPYINWFFQRAPSFFDEVCFDGQNGPWNFNHNLNAVPELVIIKARNSSYPWSVWTSAVTLTNNQALYLNTTAAIANSGGGTPWNGSPTSTVFKLGTDAYAGSTTGVTYVAYLFATCAGVSKVGSYTGTGATQTISCGFTGGARFVLVKRTDSTGDWYVWDTVRGMVSGNDPSLLLNTQAAEVNANSIYTATGGFQIVSTAAGINASGGSYIFLAIA